MQLTLIVVRFEFSVVSLDGSLKIAVTVWPFSKVCRNKGFPVSPVAPKITIFIFYRFCQLTLVHRRIQCFVRTRESSPRTLARSRNTRIMTSMGQSPWDDIKIPVPQWDTWYQIYSQMGHYLHLFLAHSVVLLLKVEFIDGKSFWFWSASKGIAPTSQVS